MKPYVVMLFALVLTGCDAPLRGGMITGKDMRIHRGVVDNTIYYYLHLKKGDRTGKVEVTEAAWKQAQQGIQWPFEIK